jgi:hypothetical protein
MEDIIQRVAESFKNPNIENVKKLMRKGKGYISDFLSKETGLEFEPGTPNLDTLEYQWFAVHPDNQKKRYRVLIRFIWNEKNENYLVFTTVYERASAISSYRAELDTLLHIQDYIPRIVINDILNDIKGDYSNKIREIKDLANELLKAAQENLKIATEIVSLSKNPIENEKAIVSKKYAIEDCKYILSTIIESIREVKENM